MNQRALQAFDAVSTQWRRDAMGRRCGLDYTGVTAALRMTYPRASEARLRRLFGHVRHIEGALLDAWRDVAGKEKG